MTSAGERWSCSITLRTEYDPTGKPLPDSLRQPARMFGPDSITNKAEVEVWLRRAQMAILSPHAQQDIFYKMSAQQLKDYASTDEKVLKFSKNVICVKIVDPESTDLSFIDLPGKR
jgi:vacuolar protein sorting-associated protein 1